MTLSYGFYQSMNHDRQYNADQFANMFDGVITDGVYAEVGNHFYVSPASGSDSMEVTVGTGHAWLKHVWVHNDSPIILPLDVGSQSVGRIDSIVLEIRKGIQYRDARIIVIKGNSSSSPTAPAVNDDGDTYRYVIANVTVEAKAMKIESRNIQNLVGIGKLSWVTSPLESIDVSSLYNNWEEQFQHDSVNWQTSNQRQFDTWVNGLKDSLNANIEAKLVSDVTDLKANNLVLLDSANSHNFENDGNLIPDPYFNSMAPGAKDTRYKRTTANLKYEKVSNIVVFHGQLIDHCVSIGNESGLIDYTNAPFRVHPGQVLRVGALVKAQDINTIGWCRITGKIYNENQNNNIWSGETNFNADLKNPTIGDWSVVEQTIVIPANNVFNARWFRPFFVFGSGCSSSNKGYLAAVWCYDISKDSGARITPTASTDKNLDNYSGNGIMSSIRAKEWYKKRLMINHRGGTGFPEQSIEGCKWAVDHGLIPEVDVRLLADGTPVLCHDDTVTRTMWTDAVEQRVNKITNEVTWREQYHQKPVVFGGKTGESPTLERLLQECGNRGILNIEVKDLTEACLNKVIGMCELYHCRNSVILASFDVDLMAIAKQAGYKTMCFTDNDDDLNKILNAPIRPDYCGVERRLCTLDNKKRIDDKGMEMTAWTVDSSKDYNACLDAGAVGITSNRPIWIQGLMGTDGGKLIEDGLAWFRTPNYSNNSGMTYPYGDSDGHGVGLNGEYLTWSGKNNTTANGLVTIEPYKTTDIRFIDTASAFNLVSKVFSNIDLSQPGRDPSIIEFWLMGYDNIDEGYVNPNISNEAIGLVFKRNWNVLLFNKNRNGSFQQKEIFKIAGANAPLLPDSRISLDINIHWHAESLSWFAGSSRYSMSDWKTWNYGQTLDPKRKYKLTILFDDYNSYTGIDASFNTVRSDVLGTGR